MDSKIIIIDANESNPELNQVLNEYQKIILSCTGPNSQLKFIQNKNDKTLLTVTNTSKILYDLLYKIESEKDTLKLIKWQFELINSSITKSHFNQYYDSGLFLSFLINQCLILKTDKKFINKILIDLIEHLSSPQSIKFKINLENLNHLNRLLTTSLSNKKSIDLNCQNKEKFINLFLKLLIKSFNEDRFSRILYMYEHTMGLGLDDSIIFDGILIKTDRIEFNNANKDLRCIIFDSNILSGDFENFEDTDLKFQVNSEQLNFQNQISFTLKSLINKLETLVLKYRLNVIFSQKVVHPSIKNYFQNVFIIDRLGSLLAEPVRELLNCKMCNSYLDLDESYIGSLELLSLVKIHNQFYFGLKSNSVQTFLVNFQNESFAQEIEYVLKVAEKSFQRTILTGYGLIGGPCFYSYCIWYLTKSESNFKNLSLIKQLFYKFLKSLLDCDKEYFISVENGHFFVQNNPRCECGMVDSGQNLINLEETDLRQIKNSVSKNISTDLNNVKLIDCYQSKLNALKIARDVLSTIFHIGTFVTCQ